MKGFIRRGGCKHTSLRLVSAPNVSVGLYGISKVKKYPRRLQGLGKSSCESLNLGRGGFFCAGHKQHIILSGIPFSDVGFGIFHYIKYQPRRSARIKQALFLRFIEGIHIGCLPLLESLIGDNGSEEAAGKRERVPVMQLILNAGFSNYRSYLRAKEAAADTPPNPS